MKKTAILLVLCMLLALAAGCSSSAGTPSAITPKDTGTVSFQDILTQHRSFLTDTGDTYQDYQVVFYGNDTGILKALLCESHFDHDAYTLEALQGLNLDEFYPGLSTLSFAETAIKDMGDYYCVAVIFRDLQMNYNLKALSDSGILQIEFAPGSEGLDSDSYIDLLLNNGAQELEITDPAFVTLQYDMLEP